MTGNTARVVAELRARRAAGARIVALVTHEETRARTLLAETLSGPTVTWSATKGLDGVGGAEEGTRDPVLALARATATREETVFVFLDLHAFFGDPRVVRALRDFAARSASAAGARAIVVLVSPALDLPVELEKDVAILELPLPDATVLGELLAVEEGALALSEPRPAGASVADHGALVRAASGLAAGEAARAFRMALRGSDPTVAAQRVTAEKRRALRQSATLELVDVDVDLEDVGGLEVLKAWLRDRSTALGDDARAFGLPAPRGVLVCGVQGCGKSLVTKAAAAALGLPLVRLDFSAVFGAASPERAFGEVVRVAEAIAPVVLWVDEVEKGLAHDALEGRGARVFGAFLTWLQERRAPVFVAATANDVERLPPELARRGRFDDVFFVDLPAASEREQILAIHLRRRGRDPDRYALADVVRPLDTFSGAELEQLVSAALFRAFAQGRELTDEDLASAARATIPLATLYEEKIAALRTWAVSRARRASADRKRMQLFE